MDHNAAAAACWASCVSECSGGISGEHIATRSIWQSKSLTVEGLPGSTRNVRVGLDSLTVNALCRHHNERLSELDDAAWDTVNAWRRAREIQNAGRLKELPCEFTVDAWRLERWAIKTVFNVAATLHRQLGGWTPGPAPAAFAYGDSALPPGAGLRMIALVGARIPDDERWGLSFGLRPQDPHPTAAFIFLRAGLRFIVTWDRAHEELGAAINIGGTLVSIDDIWRPDSMSLSVPGAPDRSLAIHFAWSADPARRPAANLAALRKRYPPPPRPRGTRRRNRAPG